MSKRRARLNEQLKRELSNLIRTQVRDPRVGLVTITGVEVAADLGSARIFVREVGGGEELAETLKGLEAAAPFLRTMLGKILHIRRIPELRFREDRSYEGARRIEEVLSDVLPAPLDEAADGEAADGEETRGAETETPGGKPETPGGVAETPDGETDTLDGDGDGGERG